MLRNGSCHNESSVSSGMAIGFILNVAMLLLLPLAGLRLFSIVPSLSDFLFSALFAIGLTQLLYMAPLYLYCRKTGRDETAKGLIVIASITAVLNVTAWGLLSMTRS